MTLNTMYKILLLFLSITLSFGGLTSCVQSFGPFAGQKEVSSDKAPAEETSEELPQPPEPKETIPRETEVAAPPKTDVSQRIFFEDTGSSTEDTRAVRRTIEGTFEPTLAAAAPNVEPSEPVVAANPGPIEPKSDTTAADDWTSKVRYRTFYGADFSKEAPRESDPALIFLNRDGTLTLKLFCEKCDKNKVGDCEGDAGWYSCPKDTPACLMFIPEDYPKTWFSQFNAKVSSTDNTKTAPNLVFENLKLGPGKIFINDCLFLGEVMGFFSATVPPDFRVIRNYVPLPPQIKTPEAIRNPEVLRQILQSAPEGQ